jgi:hypothetical protein
MAATDLDLEKQKATSQCCGYGMVYPGYEFFSSRIRVKEFKYFNPKKIVSKLSRKYDPGCSSRIRILNFLPIPDPGSRNQGSKRPRIRNTAPSAGKCVFCSDVRAAYLLRVMSRLGAAAKPTKQQQAAKRARTNKSEEPDTSREPTTATKEYKSREIIEDDDRYFLNIGGLCQFIGFLFHIQY